MDSDLVQGPVIMAHTSLINHIINPLGQVGLLYSPANDGYLKRLNHQQQRPTEPLISLQDDERRCKP